MFYSHLESLINFADRLAVDNNLFIKIHDFDGFIDNNKTKVKTVFGNYPEYCSYIRSNENALRYCLEKEVEVLDHCKEGVSFYGTCYAGVKMYIVPFFYENKVLGFISAGRTHCSYEQAESRINRTADKFGLDGQQLRKKYYFSWDRTKDAKDFEPAIDMLAASLELLRLEFSRSAVLQSPTDDKKLLCRKIIDYINMAYMGNLNLSVFTSYFNCSRSVISHNFKALTGLSIRQYINKVRLEKATELLGSSDYSVNSVARAVGFEDTNYFIKLFREEHGCSPGEYRRGLSTNSTSEHDKSKAK